MTSTIITSQHTTFCVCKTMTMHQIHFVAGVGTQWMLCNAFIQLECICVGISFLVHKTRLAQSLWQLQLLYTMPFLTELIACVVKKRGCAVGCTVPILCRSSCMLPRTHQLVVLPGSAVACNNVLDGWHLCIFSIHFQCRKCSTAFVISHLQFIQFHFMHSGCQSQGSVYSWQLDGTYDGICQQKAMCIFQKNQASTCHTRFPCKDVAPKFPLARSFHVLSVLPHLCI